MRSFEVLWTKFWTLKGLSCKDLVCKDIYANKYAGIKIPNRIFSFNVSIQNKNKNVEINLSDWGYISHLWQRKWTVRIVWLHEKDYTGYLIAKWTSNSALVRVFHERTKTSIKINFCSLCNEIPSMWPLSQQ